MPCRPAVWMKREPGGNPGQYPLLCVHWFCFSTYCSTDVYITLGRTKNKNKSEDLPGINKEIISSGI